MRSSATRFLRAIAGTTLLVGLVSGIASAGSGNVLYVDDDGKTGAAGCNGALMGYEDVQSAVDAASPGDTIRVCPGIYKGYVTISTPNLTVEGVSHWTAQLKRPLDTTAGGEPTLGTALLTIDDADGVVIRDLAFAAPAPDVPFAGICALDSMILVKADSDRVAIVGVRVRANGPATLGPCGIRNGITFAEGSGGRVTDSVVRDFAGEGIAGWDAGTFLDARRNTIEFWHQDEVLPPAPTGVIMCSYGAGLVLGSGAGGKLLDNEVVGLPTAGSTTPVICPGIYLNNAANGVVVRGNLVRYAFDGINTDGTRAFTVEDNRVLDSRNDGLLHPSSRGGTIKDNVVRRSGARGIVVPKVQTQPTGVGSTYGPHDSTVAGVGFHGPSSNLTFRGNLSTDNVGRDCLDQTVGTRTKGTADTWIGNHSDGNDRPNGLCPS